MKYRLSQQGITVNCVTAISECKILYGLFSGIDAVNSTLWYFGADGIKDCIEQDL